MFTGVVDAPLAVLSINREGPNISWFSKNIYYYYNAYNKIVHLNQYFQTDLIVYENAHTTCSRYILGRVS